jgi:hypothetical protein
MVGAASLLPNRSPDASNCTPRMLVTKESSHVLDILALSGRDCSYCVIEITTL